MSEEEIIILKTASCPSLSERSTLTYEIGGKSDKSIYIRLKENDGAGMFSKEWQSLAQIDLLLSADDKPITSKSMQPIFSGSVNSAGFLLAVLKDVGLIKNIDENSRGYIRTDPQKFMSEIHALLENAEVPQKKPVKKKKSESNAEES